MFQKIIALIVIVLFLTRLFWQKNKKQIKANEFIFWLIFWLIVAALIVNLKLIDSLVSNLGFSGSGIQILLYLAVAILFYFIFRLRLKIEKIEKDITKIVREVAIKEENK